MLKAAAYIGNLQPIAGYNKSCQVFSIGQEISLTAEFYFGFLFTKTCKVAYNCVVMYNILSKITT